MSKEIKIKEEVINNLDLNLSEFENTLETIIATCNTLSEEISSWDVNINKKEISDEVTNIKVDFSNFRSTVKDLRTKSKGNLKKIIELDEELSKK